MRNAEIADAFEELGDLYELDGAVVYRVLAYRNAAKAIRDSAASVEEMARAGTVEKLPGVGKTIAEKIDALLDTGAIPAAEKLKAKFPPGLVEVTRIPGLGPKRARKLFDELGISSLEDLRAAAEQEQLRGVAGFGPKAEENVLTALAAGADGKPKARTLLSRALGIAEPLVEALREHPASDRVELAGSARRMAETCKDLDIVATASDAEALAKAFGALPLIEEVHSSGPAGVRATTNNGLSVDLRIVPPENFGNLLQHFTGSGKHNEALRNQAVRRGFHVSEYGVIDDSTETTHACATEEEVYELLGLPYIEPELRENRGELDAARDGQAAQARSRSATSAASCTATPPPPTGATRSRRWRRWRSSAATSTSRSPTTRPRTASATTCSRGELLKQVERIRKIDAGLDGLTLLAGSEVNVLPERLARLRGRRAGAARLGGGQPAHLVPHEGEGDDRAHDPRDGASARGRDRAPHGPQDRAARGLRARHREGGGGGDPHRHLPRDQLRSRPARPERAERAPCRRGRRDAGDQLRLPRG